jgi:hypothetical protein
MLVIVSHTFGYVQTIHFSTSFVCLGNLFQVS